MIQAIMGTMARSLPTPKEARQILAARRTRPAPGPPPAAGKALTPTLKALEGKFGKGAEGLRARWREVVGESLARRSEPVRLIRGRNGAQSTLEIRVEGPSATLIQHQSSDMLARVNLFLGADSVGHLRIVQGPLRRKAQIAGGGAGGTGITHRHAPPLDAAAESLLQAELSGIADDPLKLALTRLGRAVLRRKPPQP